MSTHFIGKRCCNCLIILQSLILFTLICIPFRPAHGHGFANFAQGAKATGMGGAFVAIADDPTANYYNPAGIAFLQDTNAQLGTTIFTSKNAVFESSGNSGIPGASQGATYQVDSETNVLPFVHLTHSFPSNWAFGLSGYSMWGQKTSWPETWEGRFAPGGVEAEIISYRAQGVLAYAPSETFSLSGGVFYQWIDLSMRQKLWIPMLASEFDYSAEGDDAAPGWTVGLLVRPLDWLSFGASYRSSVRHRLQNVDVSISPELPGLGLQGTKGAMDFTTPATLFLGTAITWKRLTVAFDVYWTEWSVQDKIDIRFERPFLGQTHNIQPKGWQDSYTYSLGLEYALNDFLRLRGGYIYDESPVPAETLDPMVFNGDSQLFCLGLGVERGRFQADLSFSRVLSNDRRFDNINGDFPNPGGQRVIGNFRDSSLNIFMLSLNISF